MGEKSYSLFVIKLKEECNVTEIMQYYSFLVFRYDISIVFFHLKLDNVIECKQWKIV